MSGDITRSTFKKEKHYSEVNMQQGRVQVDADWNEQVDIQGHHDRTCLKDIIGRTGTPIDEPGFEISNGNDEKKQKFCIGAGHYYVDGILCENETEINAAEQPDLPNFKDTAVPKESGLYVVYLDVWERHLTSLDDPEIREFALGGADTATRTKIVWQVKTRLVKAQPEEDKRNSKCYALSEFSDWMTQDSIGTLEARVEPAKKTGNPCALEAETEYQGLENQLYRVEIHNDGRKAGKATWKWSRDNGAVVAKITSIAEKKLIVENVGKDSKLSFATGQYVEVIDDAHELWGIPGTLVKLTDLKENNLFFDPDTANAGGDAITTKNFQLNPKVRRWDFLDKSSEESRGVPEVKINANVNEAYLDLELGIQIKFGGGTYRTGDYWLIPARTITKDVEWPKTEDGHPVFCPPAGIQHHYAPLALLNCYQEVENGEASKELTIEVVSDLRVFFSEMTALIKLNYASGDGQEASEAYVYDSKTYFKTPYPLIASVSAGGKSINATPLKNAKVRFKIPEKDGVKIGIFLSNKQTDCDIETNENGLAICDSWGLDRNFPNQQVEAFLLDDCGNLVGSPLRFNATLPIRFYYVSGDGEESEPKGKINLVVAAAIGNTPLQGYSVKFSATQGGGTLTAIDAGATDDKGFAKCDWMLGDNGKQQAMAVLSDPNDNPVNLPPIYFNASFATTKTTASSGIAKITIPFALRERNVLVSTPINHYLENLTVPPAIILAQASNLGENPIDDRVKFMEDYGLYNFGNTSMSFKAVNVNMKTFSVQLEFPSSSTQAESEKESSTNVAPPDTTKTNGEGDKAETAVAEVPNAPSTAYWDRTIPSIHSERYVVSAPLFLRWWAIPAKTEKRYDQEAELTPRIFIDPRIVTTANPFNVTIIDPNAQSTKTVITIPGFEPMTLDMTKVDEGVFKLEFIIQNLRGKSEITIKNPKTGDKLLSQERDKPATAGTISASYTFEFNGKTDTAKDTVKFEVNKPCFLTFSPKPVGVGQMVTVTAFITPAPPKNKHFTRLKVKVTAPSGASQDFTVFTYNPDGSLSFTFTPTQNGTYKIQLVSEGETLDGTVYGPCESTIELDVGV